MLDGNANLYFSLNCILHSHDAPQQAKACAQEIADALEGPYKEFAENVHSTLERFSDRIELDSAIRRGACYDNYKGLIISNMQYGTQGFSFG